MNTHNITLLDGGMGRELERIGAPFKQPEWSALALMQAPNLVADVHRNFIAAGAQVITTNTYALVPFHIGEACFRDHGFELALQAAQIARNTIEGSLTASPIKLAGCIPPAFGSYRPDLFDPTRVTDILSPLLRAQEALVDMWLIETVSSSQEAMAVINAVKQFSDKPIWLSFSLTNRHDLTLPLSLRSQEPLDSVIPLLEQLDTVLFNCSQPEEMEEAIRFTRLHNSDITIGAYANSFSEVKRTHDANAMLSSLREDVTPERYLSFAQRWVNAGATIIGGCCGIGPEHIRALTILQK